jgi:hypothetical protein
MDFKTIVDIIFKRKHDWINVSDEEKESLFFIFNRFMAKTLPLHAQAFNTKGMDKASSMDLWFAFLRNQKFAPTQFWRGPTKRKEPEIKEWQLLQEFWELKIEDIHLMCKLFPKDVKAEIERIKQIRAEMDK